MRFKLLMYLIYENRLVGAMEIDYKSIAYLFKINTCYATKTPQ